MSFVVLVDARHQMIQHSHTHIYCTHRASTQVNTLNAYCLLMANPLKRTECELTASLKRLTSATFLTSYYWEYPAATLPPGHWSYAHTITNSHVCVWTHTDIQLKEHIQTHEWCTQKHNFKACWIIAFLPDISVLCARGGCGALWMAVDGGWTQDRITNLVCYVVKQERFTTDQVPHRQHSVVASECQVWEWDQTPILVCAPFLATAASATSWRWRCYWW